MKANIGRIVHYTNLGDRDGKYPPEVQAAIITGLNADNTVSLNVFYKTGQFNMSAVTFTEEEAGTDAARGKWAWPKRDEVVARPKRKILDVIGDVVELEERGKKYLGLCPFHAEKTPSFSVDPEEERFFCFGCGRNGDVEMFQSLMRDKLNGEAS